MIVKQFAIITMPQEGSDLDSANINNSNRYDDYEKAFDALIEDTGIDIKMPRGEQPMSILQDGCWKELWVITRDKRN